MAFSSTFPSYQFTGTFRNYQQRVLNRIPQLLADKRIHVVAAPGSGKTILGLEMICRLNQPALVIAPTIAIRDQWIERFRTHFAAHPSNTHATASHCSSTLPGPADSSAPSCVSSPTSCPPEHVNPSTTHDLPTPNELCSTDLHHPRALTVVTYQSLYSAFTRSQDPETGEDFADLDVVAAMRDAGIHTLCLDEAHHLRSAWHRCLIAFRSALKDVTTISLTATPPYDSTVSEWGKYIDLCGPIDEEISTPELVATGDLCPHQDYIYVTQPSIEESAQIAALHQPNDRALETVIKRGLLAHIMEELTRALETDSAFNEALDDEDSLLHLVNLLYAAGFDIPPRLYSFFQPDNRQLPQANALQFVISHPHLFREETYQSVVEALRAERLLSGTTITNPHDKDIARILTSSATLLRASADIAQAEYAALGSNLRLVVLADHIQASYSKAIGTDEPLLHNGVIPIFEKIRRRLPHDAPLGVLTGSVVIVPESILNALNIIAAHYQEVISKVTPLKAGYVQITFASGTRGSVRCITHAFESGLLIGLIGTAALLGEGWDAPHANAAILATKIRAFMLTNQMRGRVIRSAGSSEKTANIWHIASCQLPTNLMAELFGHRDTSDAVWSSPEISSLASRFTTFVAPHVVEPRIESGIQRCFASDLSTTYRNITKENNTMLARAQNRKAMAQQWYQALGSAGGVQLPSLLMRIRCEFTPRIRVGIVNYVEVIFGLIASALLFLATQTTRFVRSSTVCMVVMLVCAIAFAGVSLLRWYVMTHTLDPHQRLRRQSHALIQTLKESQLVSSYDLDIAVTNTCAFVVGGTIAERLLCARALEQLYGPIGNPRYLLSLTHQGIRYRTFFCQAVPDILGTKREYVDLFLAHLRRQGIAMQATYLRTDAGRAALIRARRYCASNIATQLMRMVREVTPQ
ncbi:DEAD/DEAH box helicase family protein [Trueperella sp. LYQ141]|uniref:DEAD/DEAH box helicase family protein n=1 Tax=Trueperella sp. LYQ141 TaxID=3391058 RepID=UPI003983C46C